MRTRISVGTLAALFFLAFGLAHPGALHAAATRPLVVKHAAVASDHPLASQAGLAALKAGGNAIDAACATALALGVANPQSSGIGGGGLALIYLARDKKVYALDFREKAPAALKPELFVRNGKIDPELSMTGGLAVGVPGEVRGLGEMVKRWGKRPFAKCVEPAEKLARGGVPASWLVAKAAAHLEGKSVPADSAFARMFQPQGQPIAEGTVMKRPDLAATLATLRRGGPDAFYKGPIADEMARAVREAGGVLTAEDMAAYTAVDRTPLETLYGGLRVFGMPPPSSGGIAIAETLGVLAAKGADLSKLGRGSSATDHLLAEALKHAFADRARHLGDSDFVKVPLARLRDAAYHKELAGRVGDKVLASRDAYGTPEGSPTLLRDSGTTHLSVIDEEGNAVALTSTVNLYFGAKLIAGKTGVLMNDQIDDFSLAPGVPNAFGLVGNAQNAVAPGKRPLSSMSPTLALDDTGVRVAVGAAGGPTIITSTLEVLLNVTDLKLDAGQAIAAPRIHHQWVPETLVVEPDVPRDVLEALGKRGHKIMERPYIGVVNLVVRTPQGIEAASDPRAGGAPAGY